VKHCLKILILLPFACAVEAADLERLYRTAQERDPAYAAARSNLAAGREKMPQARAGLLPEVALSANTLWNEVDVRAPRVPREDRYNTNGYTLSLTQPVFRWQNWVGFDQSKLQVALAELKFAQAQQDLILRLAQAYFDVLSSAETLDAARAARESIAQRLEAAEISVKIGVGTQTDVYDARARLEFARSQELSADAELRIRRRALDAIVGEPVLTVAGLREGARVNQPQPAEPERWVDNATGNNLAVRQQQVALEIAAREVDKQRAGHYPTVDLVASAGRNNGWEFSPPPLAQDNNTESRIVGLRLNLPVFQGGLVTSREREAAALRGTAEADVEAAKRSSSVAAFQQYIGVVNGIAQFEMLSAAAKAAEQSRDSTRQAFMLGDRPLVDVLNAETQLFNARRDRARAANEAIVAQFRLKGTVGELGEADVAAVDALLDPSRRR
jgi:outer membrane protein